MIHIQTKDGLTEKENKKCGLPFSAYGGNTLFKQCFNPEKTTVFGIGKLNQDVYNREYLDNIIKKTIITKKFKDIVGPDKYEILTVNVPQNEGEKRVYAHIVDELHAMIREYFKSTGNSRKDSMLTIIRQMQLLIKGSSLPHLFSQYQSDETPNKIKQIMKMVEHNNEKICIGCTTKKAVSVYVNKIKELDRPVFSIVGDVTFKTRQSIIKEFEQTENGVLICTQQALKSSVSIPSCNYVIIESMQWNIPKIEQFFFRFIRFDSKEKTKVYFVHYKETIEANLKALLMTKERLNDYIKTLEFRDESDILEEYDVDSDIFDMLISKNYDQDGKYYLTWGKQKIS
jgi:hypothetical protein